MITMKSHQHKGTLGNFIKDYLPDYLTCGYCAREFLLDNLTLFIAHKVKGCDQSWTSNLPRVEDSPAALTCSFCACVFMTARGLLHHVQQDHQISLCLKTDPLISSSTEVQPPPAHSCSAGAESTTNTSCFSKSPNLSQSASEPDQPTDLSITCSNFLGKDSFNFSDVKCEITIEPISNQISNHVTRPGSAVPKKRKFLFHDFNENKTISRCTVVSGDSNNISGNFRNEEEEKKCRDGGGLSLDHTQDTAFDSRLPISGTADYHKDTLHGSSISAEKKDRDKHSKLKRLLQQQDVPAADNHDLATPTTNVDTTTVVYTVPFVVPQDTETVTLKPLPDKLEAKTQYVGNENFTYLVTSSDLFKTSDLYKTSSQTDNPNRAIPRLPIEQSENLLTRSSVAPEIYSEDFEILSLYPTLSLLSSNKLKDSELNNFTFNPRSPRLLMPEEKFIFQDSFDISQLNTAKNAPTVNKPWKASLDDQSRQSKSPSITLPFLPMNSPTGAKTIMNQLEFLRKSLSSIQIPVSNISIQNSESSCENMDSSTKNLDDVAISNQYNKGQVSGKHGINVYKQQKQKASNELHCELLSTPEVQADLSQHSLQENRMWMSGPNECSVAFSEAVLASTPASNNFDVTEQDSLETLYLDNEDDSSVDGKVSKKRRYPTSRPFKCGSCDQAFNQRIHLKKHMSKHTGVKPFKCEHCDYSTVERSHLKVHYRIHTGEKPYRCMFCDYATAQNSTLKIHLKRHHEGQGQPPCEPTRGRDNQSGLCAIDDDEWSLRDSILVPLNSQTTGTDASACSNVDTYSSRLHSTEESSEITDFKSAIPRNNNLLASRYSGHVPDAQFLTGTKHNNSTTSNIGNMYTPSDKYTNVPKDDHHSNKNKLTIKTGKKATKESKNKSQETAVGNSHRKDKATHCQSPEEENTSALRSFNKLQLTSSSDDMFYEENTLRCKDGGSRKTSTTKSQSSFVPFIINQPLMTTYNSKEVTKLDPQNTRAPQLNALNITDLSPSRHSVQSQQPAICEGVVEVCQKQKRAVSKENTDLVLLTKLEDKQVMRIVGLNSDDLEYDDFDTNPVLIGVNEVVAIPDKEFVRG